MEGWEMTTTTTKPEKKKSIWTTEEIDKLKTNYGCEIIIENGSHEEIYTKKAPTDSYVIQYVREDKVCTDLTRGNKVSIFDMYWDKLKGGIKSISYGNGTIRPNLWGYKAPQQKKKRKG